MSLAALREVYNPLFIKPEVKPPLNDWKESVPVVVLSDALKIVGQKHGISLALHEDGQPCLCFRRTETDRWDKHTSQERWRIKEQVEDLFVDAIDDLRELIGAGKIILPQYQAGSFPADRIHTGCKTAIIL